MPLRVLLLSDYYPPFIGGGHRQSQLLAWQLSQRGHSVDVATIWSPGQPTQETDELWVTVHRIKQMRTVLPVSQDDSSQRHPTPFSDPVTVNELSRLITRL